MTTVAEHVTQLQDIMTDYCLEHEENNSFYEAYRRPAAIGLAVPPQMKHLLARIGWASLYLDSLEERLNIDGFRMAMASAADDRLWEWWQANNMDTRASEAHLDAMIYGRCFVTVSAPDPDDVLADQNSPVIRVESPNTVWAEIDESTGRVIRAIRVIGDDKFTLYLPNITYFLQRGDGPDSELVEYLPANEHNLGVVQVVAIVNKKRVSETYGQTEIRRSIKSAIDAACRLMMDLQAAAELMAIPQRVLFGAKFEELLSQTNGSKWEAYIANVLAFEDPDGKIAQFAAAELQNFVNAMRQLEKNVANDTGLPPQYLSFANDNPASADAIRASESRLVTKSERKCNIFGESWEQVMRLSLLVMDGEIPREAHRMETLWRDPATPSFAAMADGVVKLATAKTPSGLAVLPLEFARIKLGFSEGERKEMTRMDKENATSVLADLFGDPTANVNIPSTTNTNGTPTG